MTRFARQIIRKLSLRVGYHFNVGDINLRHHHTREWIRLHSFRHKGYWWHGAQREAQSMALFAELLREGDTVIEAGGHIGYVTLYLRQLVGYAGQVDVFEPGPNNLPYLRRNTRHHANVNIVECGLGRQDGKATIYLEHMTGQNNSFVKNFKGAHDNGFASHVTAHHDVTMTSLDAYIDNQGIAPDFVKVDVEGFELEVLLGAQLTLRKHRPALMVEVQDNHGRIFSMLRDAGYLLFSPERRRLTNSNQLNYNTFCLHQDRHSAHLQRFAQSAIEN